MLINTVVCVEDAGGEIFSECTLVNNFYNDLTVQAPLFPIAFLAFSAVCSLSVAELVQAF
jgi:hypothetical protein